MLDSDKLFARAKAAIYRDKTVYVYTPELIEYIGAAIATPMGKGRISRVFPARTRRVRGKSYWLYTLIVDIEDKQYTITTYERTQWSIT